mgnify:FL=1
MARSLRPAVYRTLFAVSLFSFLTTAILPGLALGAPLVAITRPTQGAQVSGSVWIDVAFRSDSDRPITRLELYIDDTLAQEFDLASPLLEGRQSFNWDFTYSANSVHKIGARAIDASGAANTASITVQVQGAAAAGPDRIPPVVRIYYPAQGARLRGPVEVKAEAQDNVGVELVYFYVDGRLHKMMMQAPPYTDLWDTTREADGTHVLEAVAVDAAENEARSAQVTVVVENHSMTLMATGASGDLPVGETGASQEALPVTPPAVVPPPVTAPTPIVAVAPPPVAAAAALPAVALAKTASQSLGPVVQGPSVDSLKVAPVAPPAMRTSRPDGVSAPVAAPIPAPAAGTPRPTLATTAKPAPVTAAPPAAPAPASAAPAASNRSTLTPVAGPTVAVVSKAVEMSPITVVGPAPVASPAPRVAAITRPNPAPAAVAQAALAASDNKPIPAARMLARLPDPGEFAGLPPATRTSAPDAVQTAALPVAVAKVRDIKIMFDGEVLTLRAAPETRRGLSVAPLREIFEHTDGVLYWFPVEKKVHAVNKSVDMKLTIGDPNVQVNGETRVLQMAPYIKQGRTMVPLQFIAEALDVKITFDSQSGQILIASNQH